MSKINELRAQRAKTWEQTKAFLDSRRSDKGVLSAEDTAALEKGIGVYLVTDCLLNPKGRDISGLPQGTFAAFLEFAGV